MLPISARDRIRFTPPALAEQKPLPVFMLAPLTIAERAKYRRDLAMAAKPVSHASYQTALANAAKKYLSAADYEAATALLLTDDDDSAVARFKLENQLIDACAELRELAVQRAYFNDLTVILAAKYALRGWENYPIAFESDSTGMVREAAFNALPDAAIVELGFEALRLMSPSKDQEKN